MTRFACPACGKVLQVAGDGARQEVLCPGCGRRLHVPTAPEGAPAAPAAHRRRAGAVLVLACLGAMVAAGIVVLVVAVPGNTPPTAARVESGTAERPTPAPQPDPVPPPPPPDPHAAEVAAAVKMGVDFLKPKVKELRALSLRNTVPVPNPDPFRRFGAPELLPGVAALIGYALLECGVSPEDEAVAGVAQLLRASAPYLSRVYCLSAALFFLCRLDESRPLNEQDRAIARTFALRIIRGQLPNGIWAYAGVVMTPQQQDALLASLKKGDYKPNGRSVLGQSMSNTQFAMLAVWKARKFGVRPGESLPVRPPLLALAGYFHGTQFPDGYWVYPNGVDRISATSTCAALIALAIEKALQEDEEFAAGRTKAVDTRKKADVNKAFAFLARTAIGRKTDDPLGSRPGAQLRGKLFNADAWGDLYFLWTLERVGVIYSKPRIEGKDWYDWGRPLVLQAQHADGSWAENFGPLVDSSFALLFLRRANVAQDLTNMLQRVQGFESKSTTPGPRPGNP